jgi:phosphoribosylanthranilate isomerase
LSSTSPSWSGSTWCSSTATRLPTTARALHPLDARRWRIGGAADLDAIALYPGAQAILLDAPSPGYGGSGRRVDWGLAAAAHDRGKPIFLAGGLNPENVGDAIRAARPFAVDVAGGVESAPGIKDETALRRFIDAARRGDPA